MSARRRILLTRPRERSEAFARELAPHGWDAAIWPLTELRPIEAAIPPATPQAVIYTSPAGVEFGFDARFSRLTAYCVGDATARAARGAGHVVAKSADGDSDALIALIRAEAGPDTGALLHMRGRNTAGDVAGALRASGFAVAESVVYEAAAATRPPRGAVALITSGELHAAAFFSPRASAIFAELASPDWRGGLSLATAFAISDNAAAPLASVGFGRIEVADEPNAAALRAAICGAA